MNRAIAIFVCASVVMSSIARAASIDLPRDFVHVGRAVMLGVSAPGPMTVRLDSEPRGTALPIVLTFNDKRVDRAPIYILDDSIKRIKTDSSASLAVSQSGKLPDTFDSCVPGEIAFKPAASWRPDLPAPARRTIVLIGLLIGIALLATLLIRSRPAMLLFAALTACAACFGITSWSSVTIGNVNHRSGTIALYRGNTATIDQWNYVTTRAATARCEIPLPTNALPVFADAAHAASIDAAIHIDVDRQTATLVATLHRGQSFAWVRRQTDVPYRPPATREDLHMPMELIARTFYPGFAIERQSSIGEDDFGTVVLGDVK